MEEIYDYTCSYPDGFLIFVAMQHVCLLVYIHRKRFKIHSVAQMKSVMCFELDASLMWRQT